MPKRYEQYCPMAHALDLVGERWVLLIVKELMRGPKRYTDLVECLPGIGTNILAARLRDLERHGVVARRTLPPPAASKVYDLTDYGRGGKSDIGTESAKAEKESSGSSGETKTEKGK